MNPSTIIGLVAAVLSTVSVLPQLVKIVRTQMRQRNLQWHVANHV